MKTNHSFLPTIRTIALALFAGLGLLPSAAWAQCCGDLDPFHNPGSGANGDVYVSARQSDGKVLIGGCFTSYNGVWRNNLARLTITGANDSTYSSYGVSGCIYGLAIDPNTQSAVVVGAFGQAGGYYSVVGSAKFLTNGSYDTSFSSPSLTPYPYTVAVQNDGKILIGGIFGYVGGYPRQGLARLHPNGSVDLSFNNPAVNGTVYAIKPLDDGRIIIGGFFTAVQGQPRGNLARLFSDGSLDFSFPIGGAGANSTVYAIELGTDSRILIGGEFTQMHGQSCPYVARLESDGVMPAVPSTPPNAMVRAIKAVPDRPGNDFVIAGDFTTVGGQSSQGFARFDGSTLAAECVVGTGFTTATRVHTISLLTTFPHKAFCAGPFTAYKGISRNRVAQIFIECD